MKLTKKYASKDATVPYVLDAGDGRWAASEMPAPVCDEIVRRAETLELCDEEGRELVVDGKMRFPIAAFEVEEGDIPRPAPKRKPGRKPAQR